MLNCGIMVVVLSFSGIRNTKKAFLDDVLGILSRLVSGEVEVLQGNLTERGKSPNKLNGEYDTGLSFYLISVVPQAVGVIA